VHYKTFLRWKNAEKGQARVRERLQITKASVGFAERGRIDLALCEGIRLGLIEGGKETLEGTVHLRRLLPPAENESKSVTLPPKENGFRN